MINGTITQRVGSLVEQEICRTYDLQYNKRQKKRPYYDAYNKNHIFEIKAALTKSNRFIIIRKNHDALVNANGKYILVIYDLTHKDKGLRLMSDINILYKLYICAKDIDIEHAIPYRKTLTMVQMSFKDVGFE